MAPTFDGAKLTAAREKSLLSRAELAVLLHTDPDTVRKWETGGSTPTPSKLLALTEVLGVPQTDLHSGDGPLTLKDLRRRAGLNQSHLAKHAGVSASVVSGWESGKNTVPQDIRPVLAEAFQASVADVDAAVRLAQEAVDPPAPIAAAAGEIAPEILDVSKWKATVEDGGHRLSNACALVEASLGKIALAKEFVPGSHAAEQLEQALAHIEAARTWLWGTTTAGDRSSLFGPSEAGDHDEQSGDERP